MRKIKLCGHIRVEVWLSGTYQVPELMRNEITNTFISSKYKLNFSHHTNKFQYLLQ